MSSIVIVSGSRTAMGGFQGSLSSLTAPELGAAVIRESIQRAGVKPEQVDEVIFGCVLSAGIGQYLLVKPCAKLACLIMSEL